MAPSGEMTNRQIWWIVVGLMFGMFLQGLDVLLVVTALPTIVGDLGGLDRASWALSAYLITITASVPVWGKLGDLWGRKRLFQIAIVIFTLTSLLCAGAQTMNQLIVARALQGIGGGGLMVLPVAIIAEIVPARSRARYQGALGANIAVATLLGPLVGGFFVDHATWRYAFVISVPPAGVALFASTRLNLKARKASMASIDVVGAGFVVAISVVLLLVVTWAGRQYEWLSSTILGLVGAAVALVGGLIVWERRLDEPLVPLPLFRLRGFSMLMGCAFLSGVAMYGPWAVMPLFLQLVTGASATMSGLLLLPLIVSITVASFVAGHILSRTGRYKMVIVVGMISATGGFTLYTRLDTGSSRTTAGLMMVVTGLGLGCVIQPMVVAAQGMVSVNQIGVSTSTVSFFRQLGQAFGGATALSVFVGRLEPHLRDSLSRDAFSALPPGVLSGSPEVVRDLDPVTKVSVIRGFAEALHDTFWFMVPFGVAAIIAMVFLPRLQLSDERSAAELLEAGLEAPAEMSGAFLPTTPSGS